MNHKKTWFLLLIGVLVVIGIVVYPHRQTIVAIITGCGWVEKKSSPDWDTLLPLDKNLILRGWIVDNGTMINTKEHNLECLYHKKTTVFSEFIDNYEYSKEKYPQAKSVELRPIERVYLKDELEGSARGLGSIGFIKYSDKAGALYLQEQKSTDYLGGTEISNVAIYSNTSSYRKVFLELASMAQRTHQNDPGFVPKSYPLKPFYNCVIASEFKENESTLIQSCYNKTSINNGTIPKQPISTVCDCNQLNLFIHTQAGGYLLNNEEDEQMHD